MGTENTSVHLISHKGKYETCGIALTVQLLQCHLLGFSDKAEYHDPSNEVKSSIKADCKY